jgi:adenylylsulfate kinase
VKGLYALARRGEVKDFTGISAPFEAPEHPDLSLDTSRMTLEEEVTAVVELISKRLRPEQQEDTREI